MKSRFLFIYAFVFILLGCNKYEKLLKSNDYDLKYKKAFEYYNKEDYTRAATLFEQIINVFRGSLKADSVNLYLAKSTYNQGDYVMAAEYFRTFTETYTRSPFMEQASYMIGYCYYHLSPRPELDQQDTKMAITQFELFMVKYPKSEYVPECKRLIAEMQDKLVEKSYINAKLYFNLGHYKASIVALRNSLTEYPNTEHREELKYLLLRSNYLLADKSVPEKRKERFQDALDEYFSFVDEFPKSKFKKDADKIYQVTLKTLGSDAVNNEN